MTSRYFDDTLLNNIKNFDGNNADIYDWLEDFEQITEAAGLNNTDKLRRLPVYLIGPAKDWYADSIRSKPVDQRPATFNDLKAKLLAAFKQPSVHQDELRSKIENKKQHEGQDVISYFFEMVGLCAKLDPNMDLDDKIRYIKNGFLPGILNYIALVKVKSMDEFKDYAVEAEYYYLKNKFNQ